MKAILQTATKGIPLRHFLSLAIPIVIQSLFSSSRTIVDTLMISRLGETEVAAIGAAGKPLYVMLILLLAICNGAGVISSQYWGKKELLGVQKSVVYAIFTSLLLLLPFILCTVLGAKTIIGFMSNDHQIISLGSTYLRIASFSLLPLAISLPLYTGLSSMNQLKESTIVVLWGVVSNIFLNYLLIFGIGPFPVLGLTGAAIGTLISALSAMSLLIIILLIRKKTLISTIDRLFHVSVLATYIPFLRFVAPFVFNGFIWVSGIFIYFSILGNMGVEALAVLTVLAIPELVAVAFFNGMQTASGILIAQQLGANRTEEAQKTAAGCIRIAVITGILIALLFFVFQTPLLSLFSAIQGESYHLARMAFPLFTLYIFCKALNTLLINGILRVGGDVHYIVVSDAACHWLWGIPLASFAAYYLRLPFVAVYAVIISEECLKVGLSFWRYRTNKWVKNIVDKGENSVAFCCNSST